MSDLDGGEDDTSLFSSNPNRDALKKMMPSKSEMATNNHQKKLKEQPTGSSSSDRTIQGSVERLMNHNDNQTPTDARDPPGDSTNTRERLISAESENTSTWSKRMKFFGGKPVKLIIKSASAHEVENSTKDAPVSESLPTRV
jgi:hypothetical protein